MTPAVVVPPGLDGRAAALWRARQAGREVVERRRSATGLARLSAACLVVGVPPHELAAIGEFGVGVGLSLAPPAVAARGLVELLLRVPVAGLELSYPEVAALTRMATSHSGVAGAVRRWSWALRAPEWPAVEAAYRAALEGSALGPSPAARRLLAQMADLALGDRRRAAARGREDGR